MQVASYLKVGAIGIINVVLLGLAALGIVVAVIYVQEGERRITVQYAKRVVGRRVYGGQSTHIPLKVNQAGVIPIIFASSVLLFPGTVAQFVNHPWAQAVAGALQMGKPLNTVLYFGLKMCIRDRPKRGFYNPFRVEYQVVNLSTLEERFDANAEVTLESLWQAGIIRNMGSRVKAVSYTHLDVYKRQEYTWAGRIYLKFSGDLVSPFCLRLRAS